MTLATNPQEFNAQVNSDIRDQATAEVHDALRRPENLDRWILTLIQLKRSTESQLASLKAAVSEERTKDIYHDNREKWLAYKAKMDRRRSDVIRVKNGTENKLDEAKALRDQTMKRFLKMRDAIEAHRDAVDNEKTSDAQIGAEDERLWSVLNAT